MTSTSSAPLSAPLNLDFDYTRSLGPVLGAFMAALRDRRILGVRVGDGENGSPARVLVPPAEFDPETARPLTELVPVAETGVVTTWSWNAAPLPGQPLDRPFAWALIRLDGADSTLLHAVDAPAETMRTGMRVRARWAEERVGGLRDIACFEPTDQPAAEPAEPATDVPALEPVEQLIAPVHLQYMHSASAEESRFLRGIVEGRLIGQRCPTCGKVYLPPRSACPVDGVPPTDEVEVADRGVVTTFCVVNVPFLGQRITPPYITAYVLLDGADMAIQHLILGIPAEDVRMGLRVRAVWRPREEWGHTLENISHFEPDPDASEGDRA
ncbi:Zn-ribbon domain-containing OB-fold protein [Spongisporangium articulatum]|uniref:Zn-ribbon domain-containing OB-fold protein n=1 Tax=Spongisporangium articulatum TaxID=3362603 RepID=A0ABW8ATQ9_9ACTN